MSSVCDSRLTSAFSGRFTIVCVGDVEHGDDGAGSAVARALEKERLKCVIDSGASPELDIWRIRESASDTVLFVDAVDFGGSPGDIAVMGADDLRDCGFDTHRSPMRLTMKYLESELKCRCLLLGIQPKDVRLGAEMCEEVRASVKSLTDFILRNTSESDRRG